MLVNITIPVFNEARRLPRCIASLVPFLRSIREFDWELVIADNGSTDGTLELAKNLMSGVTQAGVLRLDQKGRGLALKTAWLESKADVLSYMDVDLSTDLGFWPGLTRSLADGAYDLSIGSRLLRPEWTTRSAKREFVSRCYNRLVRLWFNTQFSDAQCGFKAITRRAAQHLIPQIRDDRWFFDTEMLIRAERHGFRILDVPVRWIENSDSRVKVLATAVEDVRGLYRLWKEFRCVNSASANSVKTSNLI